MLYIDTENISLKLRKRAINIEQKSILITNFKYSEQEKDFSEPKNCNGFGRIHHFKLGSGSLWPIDPLPNLPVAKAFNIEPDYELRTQVFQNAVCNFHCWYCFVDSKLRNGNCKYSSFLTCNVMLDLFLDQINNPIIIDLSGGQPELTPEWVPWMMEAIIEKGLEKKIYLWSDDNLSCDYLYKYLNNEQLQLMSTYKMYSRVCCFKGIDKQTFSLNTRAKPDLFEKQIEIFKSLLELNLDLYCYITLTAPSITNFNLVIPNFLDLIQEIDENLPLKIVPLQIFKYTPVNSRINGNYTDMLNGQFLAIKVWEMELTKRFSLEQLKLPITDVILKNKNNARKIY
jgi:uncharacterized Fe-S cluster-containing radical SAM superfamily protein